MIKPALSLLSSALLVILVVWYIQQQTGYDVSEEGVSTYVINQTAESAQPYVSDSRPKQIIENIKTYFMIGIALLGIASLMILIKRASG
jgi:hypothetical protein